MTGDGEEEFHTDLLHFQGASTCTHKDHSFCGVVRMLWTITCRKGILSYKLPRASYKNILLLSQGKQILVENWYEGTL